MFPGRDPAVRAGYCADRGTSVDVTGASSGPRGTVGLSGRSRCGRATAAQARINARTEPYLVASMGPVSRAVAFILPASGVCTPVCCIRTTSIPKLRTFMRSASDRASTAYFRRAERWGAPAQPAADRLPIARQQGRAYGCRRRSICWAIGDSAGLHGGCIQSPGFAVQLEVVC